MPSIRHFLILFLSLVLAAPQSWADPPSRSWWRRIWEGNSRLLGPLRPPQEVKARVPLEILSREVGARTDRVVEFHWIREWAQAKGLKVYLFGGTAAAYAHYVHWDLLREAGDQRYLANRFDYDYTKIYRSTQDLDIVVDGSALDAQALQDALGRRFPYLQGNKSQWEVRLLRNSIADKEALLENPDFLHQHTDSNSTALVEITRSGDVPVRDLRDWNSEGPCRFIRDVHEFKITYSWSALHSGTARARQGLNPPILAVIRVLTKAFQFELELDAEGMKKIQSEIDRFKPEKIDPDSYVGHWIEKNARKLVQNAVNIEFAIRTLDDLGLRKKLIALGDPQKVGTQAWWLNRKPLPSFEVGSGFGRTARSLGLDILTHDTRSYLDYESITKSPAGIPNVLSSRRNIPGEAASQGEGVYFRPGKKGALSSGLPVHARILPEAREGRDFLFPGTNEVVLLNRAAFEIVPESLDFSIPELVDALKSGRLRTEFDETRMLVQMLPLRMRSQLARITPEERALILEWTREELARSSPNEVSLRILSNVFGGVPGVAEALRDRARNIGREIPKGRFFNESDLLWQSALFSLVKEASPMGGNGSRTHVEILEILHQRLEARTRTFLEEGDFGEVIRMSGLREQQRGSEAKRVFSRLSGTHAVSLRGGIWIDAIKDVDDPLNLLFLLETDTSHFFTGPLASEKWVKDPHSEEVVRAALHRLDLVYASDLMHGLGGWGHHPQALAILDAFFKQGLMRIGPKQFESQFVRSMDYWMLERKRDYEGHPRKSPTWLDVPELVEICKPHRVNGECLYGYYLSGKRFSSVVFPLTCSDWLK